MPIDIQTISALDVTDLLRIASAYASLFRYTVAHSDNLNLVSFELRRETLPQPYVRRYCFEENDLRECQRVATLGYSFGAFSDSALVGLILAEPQMWNRSMCVREFHVAESHRRQGIGSRLIEALAERARSDGFRILVCETQTTNELAIAFYRRLGFVLDGIDLSYYSNEDYPDGEIAVFMKKRLT